MGDVKEMNVVKSDTALYSGNICSAMVCIKGLPELSEYKGLKLRALIHLYLRKKPTI